MLRHYGLVASGSAKVWQTPEGGLAIRMLNATGAISVKGTVVHPSSSVEGGVALAPVDDLDPVGVVWEAGVPNGGYMWVVVSGAAYVKLVAAPTLGHYIRLCVAADTGDAAGLAIAEALPTSPFATDKHFQECGHVLSTTAKDGLYLCAIHFN